MAEQPNADALIKIDVDGTPTFEALDYVTDWDYGEDRPEAETDVLGQTAPLRLKDKKDFSASLTVVKDPSSATQTRIRDQADADADIVVQILNDGTTGIQFDAAVTNISQSGSADPAGFQEETYELNVRHETVTTV